MTRLIGHRCKCSDAFSRVILIGRGLKKSKKNKKEKLLSSFQRLSEGKESGDDGAVDTPVPIPNTEVKHRCGEGSPWQE